MSGLSPERARTQPGAVGCGAPDADMLTPERAKPSTCPRAGLWSVRGRERLDKRGVCAALNACVRLCVRGAPVCAMAVELMTSMMHIFIV